MNNITIKTLLNKLHKHKGFVYVWVGFSDFAENVVEAHIRSRTGSRGCCSGCGRKGPTYDHTLRRRWRFVPLWGLPVYLVYTPRRIDCPTCGVKIETMPWATGKAHRKWGVIEGLNNKAKLSLRKSYGFKTDKAREIALFHALGKLPEPQLTHEFF